MLQPRQIPPLSRARPRAQTKVMARPDLRLVLGGMMLVAGLATAAWAEENADQATTDQPMISAHGYSYFGNLDYPADYAHFDFVNPDAPKGGEISLGASGTFDSLNPYSRKGRPGALTSIQYDQLIESVEDSVGQYYGVLAESLEYPESKDWVIFHMRPEATFSDGTPVTAHDVVYSHKLMITQGLPSYAQAVSRMVPNAEALDDHTVKFHFNPEVSRRSLIETVGSTPVFQKAWFEADPENRRLDEPRLEFPPGSGPYILDDYEINRRITYKLRDDYWGKDLPFNKGRHNYGSLRIEYFADQTASFEAFKAGEYTIRVESDPKIWASNYDFPKVNSGDIVKHELPNGSPPNPTGFVFNLATPQLQDKAIREAIALAFNFEWTNESLLFGLYSQRSSFIQGTPLEAKDLPTGKELEFLKSLGDVVPDALLTEPARLSHSSNGARLNDRRNLRKASQMLEEAGWVVGDDGIRRNSKGEELQVDMLYPSNIQSSVEAMHETFAQNLALIGVKADLQKVDPSQYTERRRKRQFDILYSTIYDTFLSTGGGLSQMYGSKEAEFSLFNPAGLASPLVDAIIEASFVTDNQEDQDAALKALDRALRYEFFVIPTGYIADYWVAAYDMYERPEKMAPYALGYRDYWWINPEKEAALKAKGALK